MPKLPRMNGKEMVKALTRAGFFVHHQTGSHVHLRHAKILHLRVTIPCHTSFNLPLFVIKSILKQAELPLRDFLKLL